jgi:predicted lipoprotein with Yx(FWY)xxD motif
VRNRFALGATAVSIALIAGCGSGSKSASTTVPAAARSAAQTTPASAAAGYTATSSSTTATAVLITSKQGKLGTILAVGPKQRTVYLFESDKGAGSSCNVACTQVWPPVTSAGEPRSAGGAIAAHLGTITRPDGTKQVTYAGHPLYLFARDGDKSDAYGQGVNSFGASWYVISPSGSKVDHS